jgi:hypothetical protein
MSANFWMSDGLISALHMSALLFSAMGSRGASLPTRCAWVNVQTPLVRQGVRVESNFKRRRLELQESVTRTHVRGSHGYM